MRKSEPDVKYFGESSENEVFLVKTYKNHPKTLLAGCRHFDKFKQNISEPHLSLRARYTNAM